MNSSPSIRAAAAEQLLRGDAVNAPAPRECVRIAILGGAVLGMALGGSSGDWRLCIYAAIKVPLLLVFTTCLCLPSFFVVTTLLGLRDDFAAAVRALIAAQAVLGITLAALAPMSLFLSASLDDANTLTLLDAAIFATATGAGHRVLGRHYQPLLARNARHRIAMRGWVALYAFAGIQLAWTLRPFRGTPGLAVQFLRPEALEQNAYVVLFEHLARVFR